MNIEAVVLQFAFQYLMIEEYCFPPNLYVAMEYVTFAFALVTVVAGVMLCFALLAKTVSDIHYY